MSRANGSRRKNHGKERDEKGITAKGTKGASKEEKPKAVDVENIDLTRMKDRTTDLPSLIEYAHSVGGFAVVPTEQGVIKGNAMNAMNEQTQEKMDMILEQMRVLAKQAQDLKTRVEISQQIYEAEMSFDPVMGKSYYLYEKEDGSKRLSLIAPNEWGDSDGFSRAVAKVKLQFDHTWKVEEEYPEEA